MVSTKTVHTSGTLFEKKKKRKENVQKCIQPMFPYRVTYTESEYDIQNNDLLYKIHPKCQNIFEILEHSENSYFIIFI